MYLKNNLRKIKKNNFYIVQYKKGLSCTFQNWNCDCEGKGKGKGTGKGTGLDVIIPGKNSLVILTTHLF